MIRSWTWERLGWVMAYLYSWFGGREVLVRFAEWWQGPFLERHGL